MPMQEAVCAWREAWGLGQPDSVSSQCFREEREGDNITLLGIPRSREPKVTDQK